MPDAIASNFSNALPASGMLGGLSDAERDTLRDFGDFVDHRKGDVLVEQGKPQAFLHLVLEGELRVSVASPEQIVTLGYVQSGECVGEMTLLEVANASATVVANTNCRVWAMNRAAFERFCEQHPRAAVSVVKAVAIVLSHRLRNSSQRLLSSES